MNPMLWIPAAIVAADAALLVAGVPRLAALAGTVVVTLGGVLVLAAIVGRRVRRLGWEAGANRRLGLSPRAGSRVHPSSATAADARAAAPRAP